MDAARELAQILHRLRQLVRGRRQQRAGVLRRLLELGERQSQRDGHRDESLLGAVVEVALELLAGIVGGAHDPRPRGPHLLVRLLVRDRLRGQVGEAPQSDLGADGERLAWAVSP